jgi:hypothetical protein
MNCCVCYEEKEVYYNCKTCEEGKICWECFLKKSNHYCLDYLSREELLPILSCPCCRTINWKVLYNRYIDKIKTADTNLELFSYIKTHKDWWKKVRQEIPRQERMLTYLQKKLLFITLLKKVPRLPPIRLYKIRRIELKVCEDF